MMRAWSITFLIGLLTVLWTLILVPIAGFLSIDSIDRVFPGFKDAVDNHKNIKSIIVTQLPTLLVSLLNIAVPYLYDCASPNLSLQDDTNNPSRAREPPRNDWTG